MRTGSSFKHSGHDIRNLEQHSESCAGLGNGSALPVEIDGMREIAELRVMSAAVKEFREALAVVAADAASTPPTQALKRHARGIVISAGGELQFVNAYATMRV